MRPLTKQPIASSSNKTRTFITPSAPHSDSQPSVFNSIPGSHPAPSKRLRQEESETKNAETRPLKKTRTDETSALQIQMQTLTKKLEYKTKAYEGVNERLQNLEKMQDTFNRKLREMADVCVGFEEERVRRMFPPPLMKSKRSLGDRCGPSPVDYQIGSILHFQFLLYLWTLEVG